MDAIEDPAYYADQLISYIGNKRALLRPIYAATETIRKRLGRPKLRVFDVFSGSGVVSRFLKAGASYIVANDAEDYAATISRCYLRNASSVRWPELAACVADMNDRVDDAGWRDGFVRTLYAPRREDAISAEDRVVYTVRNARRIDNYRRMIDGAPAEWRDLLLGPLLHGASVHANNPGVFKGFYKNKRTGIGQYGGTTSDSLKRIKGAIRLDPPVLSRFECEYRVCQGDANKVAKDVKDMDVAYIDPPYNHHPYGSNYFMLNLIVRYEPPTDVSRVAGIPTNWRRSGYNVRARSLPLLAELFAAVDAPFLLVSFNDDGFVSPADMLAALSKLGAVQTFETRYNTYRGSRNLRSRALHVVEHLFLVERR